MPIKKNKIFILIIFIMLITYTACYKNEHFVDFTSDELTRLISGDSVKSWIRVRLSDNGTDASSDPCSINLIYSYSSASNDQSNLGYEILKNPSVCNGIDTLIESGGWYIIEGITSSNLRDSLVMINNGDTLRFGISSINSTDMKLISGENGGMVEEEFEWYNP
jgi:hypothetical protein